MRRICWIRELIDVHANHPDEMEMETEHYLDENPSNTLAHVSRWSMMV